MLYNPYRLRVLFQQIGAPFSSHSISLPDSELRRRPIRLVIKSSKANEIDGLVFGLSFVWASIGHIVPSNVGWCLVRHTNFVKFAMRIQGRGETINVDVMMLEAATLQNGVTAGEIGIRFEGGFMEYVVLGREETRTMVDACSTASGQYMQHAPAQLIRA